MCARLETTLTLDSACLIPLPCLPSESGKPDQATESVQRALTLDASAGRAWEYLGGLAEKELRYAGAAAAERGRPPVLRSCPMLVSLYSLSPPSTSRRCGGGV